MSEITNEQLEELEKALEAGEKALLEPEVTSVDIIDMSSYFNRSIQNMFKPKFKSDSTFMMFNGSNYTRLFKIRLFLEKFIPEKILRKFDKVLKYEIVRQCLPCSYLAIAFNDGQQKEALDILSKDLEKVKNLYVNRWVSKPSILELYSETSTKKYVLFSFLFLSPYLNGFKKFYTFNDNNVYLDVVKSLKDLGVKSVSKEGGLGLDISK